MPLGTIITVALGDDEDDCVIVGVIGFHKYENGQWGNFVDPVDQYFHENREEYDQRFGSDGCNVIVWDKMNISMYYPELETTSAAHMAKAFIEEQEGPYEMDDELLRLVNATPKRLQYAIGWFFFAAATFIFF